MDVQKETPTREKVKTACCAVLSFLMIVMIIINIILVFQIYIFKEEVPNICGFFPIISLTDEASPQINNGDLILCKKISDSDADNVSNMMEGKIVTHFDGDSRSAMCVAPFVSSDGNTATLLSPKDKKTYRISADEVVG
jgi:hypothetical protein